MKILMLTPYLPYPPSSGGQIRSYNLIKQLSKNHKITLCSLIKSDLEKQYISKLEPFCENVHIFKRPEKPWTLSNILKTGFSLLPFLVIRNFSPSEKKALKEIVREGNFDLIHAETFYVYPHIPKVNIPVVLVDQTIEYEVYKHYVDNYKITILKPLLYIDVSKVKYWETHFWKKASRVIAVSEKDGRLMKEQVKHSRVRVVPNGVGEDLMEEVPLHYNKTVSFVANFLWLQNAEAARILAKEVFPKILAEVPDAKLVIAGQYTEKIRDLQSHNVLLKDLKIDDITGIQEAYRTGGVLVAPLYGPGGTRLKILAAMAAKLPIVTTKVGIAEIGEAERTYLEGETAEELAEGAIRLLKDRKLYKKIALAARKLVEEKYSYQAISKQMDKVYGEVVKNG